MIKTNINNPEKFEDNTEHLELSFFEKLIENNNHERYATRNQIKEFYNVPRTTLLGNIKKLKKDDLIKGTKIRHVANDGRTREQEVYNIDEVIVIGLRLSSTTAIKLQRFATNQIKQKLFSLEKKNRSLELELGYFWNKSDRNDLYR